jgi:hypothetical protein
MNIYTVLRKLAKTVRAQNLFIAAKEINGMQLFHNVCDFSKLQEIYINYLYMYDVITRDIITEKISEDIFKDEIYEDAYMYWKRKKGFKVGEKNEKDLKLTPTNKITFPKKR